MMFSGIKSHRECQARIITLMIGECSLKINNIIREKSERERANVILRFDTTFRCSAALEAMFDSQLQA